MNFYIVRCPNQTGLLSAVIVLAADTDAALAAAMVEAGGRVTDGWTVTLLSDLVSADAPARSYNNYGLVFAGERKPGQ
jgi:UTP:GlnB (protein PII) uridylyltransferase